MAANQRDEESNIVVDLRTRVSNLSKYIDIMDKDETQLKELRNNSTAAATSEPSQIHVVHVAIEQLQRDQRDAKKVFNQLLEEFSRGGGNVDDLGFKILEEDVVVESSSSSKPKGSKKDVVRRKRSEWSKELKNREGVKAYAVEVGTLFSFLLVHLMLFVLQRREIAVEFQRLKNSVRSLMVGTKSLVPNRMDRVIQIAEAGYQEKKAKELEMGIRSPVKEEDIQYEAVTKNEPSTNCLIKSYMRFCIWSPFGRCWVRQSLFGRKMWCR